MRYKELLYQGKTLTQEHEIDAVLARDGFGWILDAEISNARLEIDSGYLVWNAGVWYNGTWKMGDWRGGTWKFGRWEDGVFYNGDWEDGLFVKGIIGSRHHKTTPKFFHGQILAGEVQSGELVDCDVSPSVEVFPPTHDKSRDF